MALQFKGGKAVPAGQDGKAVAANKAKRDAQLHRFLDTLGKARDMVQAESQKLPNFDMPNEAWNQQVANMQKFHEAIRELYSGAASFLHLQ